ncbi:MAG TPA: tetratricopeptide repeat protein [Gemmatimonadales bacterium]|nr:tetratricopeptide repeat protein [Gemmatimonadales bacterium]
MSLVRVAAVVVFGAVLVAPVSAQVPRRPREQQVATLPRLMVANPYVTSAADSAAAVQVGGGMRERMSKAVDGDYNVLASEQMNEALKQYGYPANAILTPALAAQLAKSIQARVLVSSTMNKAGNNYAVTARLVGMGNEEAGSVVAVTQSGGSLGEFGGRVVEQLQPALKSLNDARDCVDLSQTKPDKAAEAARKALKQYPGNGLASYCLGQIALKKKDRKEAVQHFQAAAKADPMSLAAWSNLAEQYQAQNDTANVIAALREMLRIAPTNQKLREQAFKYFLNAERPQIAREVADSGIKIDPYNPDFYDLKSNACAFLSDFRCSVDALEQSFAVDSNKADTLFVTKILAFSEQRLADTSPRATAADTARYLKWAQYGARKYPANVGVLQALSKAYGMTGQVDSTIAVAQRLVAANPQDVTPLLSAAQTLITTKRSKEAMPLIQLAADRGDAQAKENAAALLYQSAAPLLQEPVQDYAGAAELLRGAVKYANPQGKVYPAANYLLGLATLLQVPKIDPEAEKTKSCDLARQEEALLLESERAFTAGQSANPEVARRNLDIIKKYKPRAGSMVKAYCK